MPDETKQPDDGVNEALEPENTVENEIPDASTDNNPVAEISETEPEVPDDIISESPSVDVINEVDRTSSNDPASEKSIDDPDDDSAKPELSIEQALETETAEGNIEVISEVDLEADDETELVVTTFELSDEDDEDDEVDSSELNIAIEAATEPVTVLNEEDLDLLEKVTSKKDDDEEIVVKDYLNEDDGDAEFMPDYLKPPEPEWKRVARQMREDREAKQREMLEKRREEDKRVIEERKSRLDEREELKRQQEENFSQAWEKRQSEKQQAYDEMIQRIRKEREEKLQERAETEEREFGRKFTYPKPEERKPYPKPSELKRMEREQPKNVVDDEDNKQPSPPLSKPKSNNFEDRVSRLSKPDESSNTKPDEPENSDSEE